MNLPQPGLVAHADWSSSPNKRWLCRAVRSNSGYIIEAPQAVGTPGDLPARLMDQSTSGGVLLGVDFPLGIPLAYAQRVRVRHFADWLPGLGQGDWSRFFDVCESRDDIGLQRPFYPRRPGGTSQAQLFGALGLDSMDALRRRCELSTAARAAACSLFWTLGAQQVGRAAISGWRDLLQNARRQANPKVKLWPFEGSLQLLLADDTVVIAEAYPAESAIHIGLSAPGRGWSKRRQQDRAAQATTILRWADRRGVTLCQAASSQLRDGFGSDDAGEDQFDCMLGAAGMLEVVLGYRPEMPAMSIERQHIEGWILGQG